MNYQHRIQEARAWLAKTRSGALLLTEGADVRYLCGFSGSHALLLLLPRSTTLFTDGRYTTQAAEQTRGSGARIVVGKGLLSKALARARQARAASVAYDASRTPVAVLRAMEETLPTALGRAERRRFFAPLDASPVAALRQRKDADELAVLEEAAGLGCTLFDRILPHLEAGVAEREIAAELEYAARQMGADGMSFDTIVASGPRSAMPHGHAAALPLPRRGFVTLDFGVILRGYCSDMTRTVYLGKPTREERAAYGAVLEAELAGVQAVRAGARASAVDGAARGVLRRNGLAPFFTHSTGHGVGLEIHEGPRLARAVKQTLDAGMVITVEPGVYLPGRFGIRIEDMVAVEATGPRILTMTPKELLTL